MLIKGGIVRSLWRRLGNILAALSLLLSLGLAGMWVRSYWQNEKACRWWYSRPTDETKQISIASGRGKVEVTLLRTRYPPGVMIVEEGAEQTKLTVPGFSCSYPNGWWKFNYPVAPPPRQHWWEHLGIFVRLDRGLRWGMSPGIGSHTYLGAPYWLLFGLTVAAPALRGLRWWKRRRRFQEGRCGNCGYDLRETPDRCPECGVASCTI
jgi:hypothetical protein